MKKIVVLLVVFVAYQGFGQSYEDEYIYTGSNGNTIEWINRLPNGFPKVNNIQYFSKKVEEYEIERGDENGIPDCTIVTYLDKKDVVLAVVVDDERFFKRIYRASKAGGYIFLSDCYHYMKFLNNWFFDNISSLNPDKHSVFDDLSDFNFVYVFTLKKGNDTFQIQGGVGRSYDSLLKIYINDIVLREPVFVKVGNYSGKIFGRTGIDDFLSMMPDSPYNAITKEHKASYLLYLFFNDTEFIKDIPPLE
jgi:SAM-dependent methyltransferase